MLTYYYFQTIMRFRSGWGILPDRNLPYNTRSVLQTNFHIGITCSHTTDPTHSEERQIHMSERLIDHIAEKSGLYVSDLLLAKNSAEIIRIVSSVNPEDFTVDDWSASLSYLCQRHLHFATAAAAKDYYLKSLLNNLMNCC